MKEQLPGYAKKISSPLTKSPIVMLDQIQNGEKDVSACSILSKPVIPAKLIGEVEVVALSNEEANKNQRIHNRCIFDALNDALDICRPLGLRGVPMPWSNKVRDLSYHRLSTEQIMEKAKDRVLDWSKVEAGGMADGKSALESLKEPGQVGDKIGNIREEKLCKMLHAEVAV